MLYIHNSCQNRLRAGHPWPFFQSRDPGEVISPRLGCHDVMELLPFSFCRICQPTLSYITSIVMQRRWKYFHDMTWIPWYLQNLKPLGSRCDDVAAQIRCNAKRGMHVLNTKHIYIYIYDACVYIYIRLKRKKHDLLLSLSLSIYIYEFVLYIYVVRSSCIYIRATAMSM